MSFRIVTGLAIAEDRLTASTVSEDPNAEWSQLTTYSLGAYARVTATHRLYYSLQAGNLNHDPVASPTWWQDVGPTNRYAMFDSEIGTATSTTDQVLEAKVLPGQRITDVAFFGLQATKVKLIYRDAPSGNILFSEEQSLSAAPVIDWTTYWTAPFIYRKEALFAGIPGLASGELTITITGDGVASTECGVCVIGTGVSFGVTLVGAELGFVDYSRRDVDPDFGTVSFTKRDSAKTLKLPLEVPAGMLSAVLSVLESVRGVPAVWIPLDDNEDYAAAMVFGWLEDSSCTLNEVSVHHYTLMIKGLT